MWAGISTIASVLERKVFTTLTNKLLYPNLYVILVSPPGIGKSVSVEAGQALAKTLKDLALSPTVITKEKLYDVMEGAYRAEFHESGLAEQSAVTAFADEMAVFIKRGDMDFMAVLAKLYDNPTTFEKGTRTTKSNHIVKPCLNLIGGVTPVWVKDTFTDDAFETGFPARTILVYDETEQDSDLFDASPIQEELSLELRHDLAIIHELKGEFRWEASAARAFQSWVHKGMPPRNQDARFVHYNRRRVLHIAKLCMVVSASFRSDLVITEEDFEQARSILLDAESQFHHIAAVMGSNPYKHQMDAIYHFVRTNCRNGNGVREYRVRQRLAREVPVHLIEGMLDSMVEMHMLDHEPGEEAPNRIFFPGKQLHLLSDREQQLLEDDPPDDPDAAVSALLSLPASDS